MGRRPIRATLRVAKAQPTNQTKPRPKVQPNSVEFGPGVRPGHRRCPAASPAALRAAEAQPKAKPKARPKVQPHSVGFRLRAPGVGRRPSARRPGGSKNRKSTTHSTAPILRGAFSAAASGERIRSVSGIFRPSASGAAGRPLTRGLSYSLSAQSMTNKFSPTHRPSQAPSSAQRGSKTVTDFRARRTVTAHSSSQFSAPCPPHCGSAVAPPRLPSPAGISSRFCSPQNE